MELIIKFGKKPNIIKYDSVDSLSELYDWFDERCERSSWSLGFDERFIFIWVEDDDIHSEFVLTWT